MIDISVRRKIESAANAKALGDYELIMQTCDDIRNSFAVGDVFSSKSVPFLKSKNPPPISKSWQGGPILYYKQTDHSLKCQPAPRAKKLSSAEATKIENTKLTNAFEMMKELKNTFDTGKIFFHVAATFEEIAMYVRIKYIGHRWIICLKYRYDRAIKFYTKAARIVPSDKYVDEELLPDTKEHRRKLERLGGPLLQKYVTNRAAERAALLLRENTHRRVRSIMAHCALFKLHVFASPDHDYLTAHFHLRQAFQTCVSEMEHNQLLYFFHAYLSNFCVSAAKLCFSCLFVYIACPIAALGRIGDIYRT
jgi:hypothetical protein